MRNREVYFILAVFCFLIYANSLKGAFVSDDVPAIVNNNQISSISRYLFIPSELLNSINYLIGKDNPFYYHLSNVILHVINSILIFLFLNLWFKKEGAFLGAALFAAHPIHTEAVSWISGGTYIIISLFVLSGYLLYHKAANRGRFNIGYYLASLLIFSYFIVNNFSFYFLFPFLLVLSDLISKKVKNNFKWWMPFFAILILRLVFVSGRIYGRITQIAQEATGEVTWTNPIFNMVYSVFSHLGLLIWPAKLTLYHEPAVITTSALKAGIVILGLLGCALPFIYRKAKILFFAIGIFVLFLVPTFSPVMVAWLVAERYLYFPSVALSIFFAFCYERYVYGNSRVDGDRESIAYAQDSRDAINRVSTQSQESRKRRALSLAIFIIAAYSVRTVARNEDWKTPTRLWRQTVLVSYNSPRAHNNMGDVYSQEGNIEGAIAEFKKSIELKPAYADGYYNLANTYHRKGDLNEAIKFYQQAVNFNPRLFEGHYNLGVIYLNSGDIALAKAHLAKAVSLRPNDTGANTALNIINQKQTAD